MSLKFYNVQGIAEFDQQIQKTNSRYQENEKLPYNIGSQTTYLIKNTGGSTLP